MEPISRPSLPFQKLFSSNQSGSSITKPSPTITEPSGNGIYELLPAGLQQTVGALFAFYGTRTSADNETMTARISAWRKIGSLWIPTPLLLLAITQGTSVGVASQDVVATEYFADTITATTAFTSAYEIISPVDDTIALVKVDPCGAQKLQVQVAKGTNATANCLASAF